MLQLESAVELAEHVGRNLGASDWLVIDQDLINRFAQTTQDFNWVHVDVERAAAEMPGGKTIAHGLLMLSLLPGLNRQILQVRKYGKTVLNYGFDRVRFMCPVRVGSRVRLHATVTSVERKASGLLINREMRMEVDGSEKPALVAQWLLFVGDT